MGIGVLGPVIVDGEPLSGARRVALLLRLLIDPGHVVPTSTLVTDLWGIDAPDGAATTLQSHVSKLRGLVGRDRLVHRSGGYTLSLDEGDLDAAVFERDLGAARDALRAGDPRTASTLVERALALWRGAAFQDVADREWAVVEVARLDELRASAVEFSLEARLALGEHEEVVDRAEVAVAEEPLREQRWAHLMTALYRCGRQADALRAFSRVQTILADELGLVPSPALCALEAAILEQRLDLDARPAALSGGLPEARRPSDEMEAARAAFGDGQFAVARDLLVEAAARDSLAVPELELLADAAWFAGDPERSIEVRQELFASHTRARDDRAAARAAIWMVINYVTRVRMAVAAGWFHKARRLLEGRTDTVEHGYLDMVTALFSIASGDMDTALEAADAALEAAHDHADADLEAMAVMLQGVVRIRSGEVVIGSDLIDEAMATASSGVLGPFATGLVYCRSLCACLEVGDYRRAAEWLEVAGPWVDGSHVDGFPGDCRAHRAEVLLVRGSWDDAAREARQACEEAVSFDLSHSGLAYRELGEIELRRGRLDEAEDALRRAQANGVSPEPGRSLLHLLRGDADRASDSIGEALATATEPLERSRLLPAAAEIALATSASTDAAARAMELSELADRFSSVTMEAGALAIRASIALVEGDAHEAVALARTAHARWREAASPYEEARALLTLAVALSAAGDDGAARHEGERAAGIFSTLGATSDLERAEAVAFG